MSFKLCKSRGRTSTLLMVLLPTIMGISIALLSLLGLSPSIFFYLIFIILNYSGYVLFLVAMKGFAKYYDDSKIFKNCLYAFIVSLTGGIISFILTFTFVIPIRIFPSHLFGQSYFFVFFQIIKIYITII